MKNPEKDVIITRFGFLPCYLCYLKFNQNILRELVMNNIWIIAQTEDGGTQESLLSEDMTSGSETSTANTSQDGSNGGSQGQETQKKPETSLFTILLPILMIFMVVMMFSGPRKQKQQRKKLEQSLEKNDRVLTIGGIYGTIVDIKDDEITLKVDESNNTKVKVTRSAIGRNMSKD